MYLPQGRRGHIVDSSHGLIVAVGNVCASRGPDARRLAVRLRILAVVPWLSGPADSKYMTRFSAAPALGIPETAQPPLVGASAASTEGASRSFRFPPLVYP